MKQFPRLVRRMVDHLPGSPIRHDPLPVFVGTRLLDDGWVAVVLRIDGFSKRLDAAWLGDRVPTDLLDDLSFVNQENVPIEAVKIEVARSKGARFYSLAALWPLRI